MRRLVPEHAGLRWETEDGLPRCVTSRDGTTLVRARRDSDGPRLTLCLPDRRQIDLVLDATEHPVLGRCDVVEDGQGEILALASRVDWRRPAEIPALDRPGALPRGAGTAILNLLAWQAVIARAGPLRYRGPYPSEALWQSLRASFAVTEPEAAAKDRFLAGAQARAVAGTRTPITVDFHPRPHAWHFAGPRVCVQRRASRVERVYVDGRAFDRDVLAPRRLLARDDTLVAAIVLGHEVWCECATLGLDGALRDAPRPLPAATPELRGTVLPAAVTEILGEVLCAQAPSLLQPAMRTVLASTTMRWGDPGPALVRWSDDALELHAGMVAALPTDPTTLLGVLVGLLEDPLRRRAAAVLHAAWATHTARTVPATDRSFST